ncbi:TniB family NTP-binding protein [uncultured Psychromonas sp.]|uniref:TniB family NTP-binding protein n=1 Tax=uncultured Psychromonas sp. TaxID=173974 RepID=UPI00261074E4|nr:TniB family NTP-binding protein [uncultured Psychromonas sp.]
MNELSELQLEQLRVFSDCIVMHPQVKTIYNDFDDLRLNRMFQTDQQCMLLTGDTGVGKSHLINHYKKRVLATQNNSRETIPVLVSRISSGKGLDATLIQMLADLDLFGSSQRKKRGYKTDLTKKLVESLIRAKVELLIINEFQELIEFKTLQERQLIANGLKYISEEAKIPIVLVGMPWAEKIAEEPQWSSRLVRKRKLEYFSLQKDSKYYRQYLMGLAKSMPFAEPPKLEEQHTAVALFSACKGENRSLKHLLTESLKLALSHNEVLDKKHFITAYDKLYLANSETHLNNPFKQKLEDILISEVEKSSKYDPNAIDPEYRLVGRIFSKSKTLAALLSK